MYHKSSEEKYSIQGIAQKEEKQESIQERYGRVSLMKKHMMWSDSGHFLTDCFHSYCKSAVVSQKEHSQKLVTNPLGRELNFLFFKLVCVIDMASQHTEISQHDTPY